jgi:hypothetical protein
MALLIMMFVLQLYSTPIDTDVRLFPNTAYPRPLFTLSCPGP